MNVRRRRAARSGTGRAPRGLVQLAAAAVVAVSCSGSSPVQEPQPGSCAAGSAGPAWLAFASRRTGNYEIWRARADGTCLAQVTDDPGTDLDPSWSHSAIAFASDRGGPSGIWLHDLTTGRESALATGGLSSAAAPAFSPDGALVAFEGRAGAGASDVYVVPAAGGAPVALASHPAEDGGPAWAPDGRSVYFVSRRTGAHEVWSVALAGGDPEQVTTGSRIIGRPAVTPDGRALLYARVLAGAVTTEVVRLELATGALAGVTSADDSEPAVAPGGDRVAVRSFRAGHADVVVVGPDGADPVALTDDETSDGAPAFAPTR